MRVNCGLNYPCGEMMDAMRHDTAAPAQTRADGAHGSVYEVLAPS